MYANKDFLALFRYGQNTLFQGMGRCSLSRYGQNTLILATGVVFPILMWGKDDRIHMHRGSLPYCGIGKIGSFTGASAAILIAVWAKTTFYALGVVPHTDMLLYYRLSRTGDTVPFFDMLLFLLFTRQNPIPVLR